MKRIKTGKFHLQWLRDNPSPQSAHPASTLEKGRTMKLKEMQQRSLEARQNPPTIAEYEQKMLDAGLDATTIRQALVRFEQMPQSQRLTYFRIVTGKASPQDRIKSFCIECMGYEKLEVADCTDKGCTLYGLRPIYGRKSTPNGQDAQDSAQNGPE